MKLTTLIFAVIGFSLFYPVDIDAQKRKKATGSRQTVSSPQPPKKEAAAPPVETSTSTKTATEKATTAPSVETPAKTSTEKEAAASQAEASALAKANEQQKAKDAMLVSSKMTSREKVAMWKGEKVIFLGSVPLWCTEKPKPYLRGNKYRGQSGIIIETMSKSDTDHSLVIELDKTKERVTWDAYWGLGFYSELEAAKTWVGRSLWAKGPHTMEPDSRICLEDAGREGRLPLHNLEKVTITRAEFGDGQTILFFVKTEDGREGWLDGWDGWDRFDDKFHIYFDSDSNKHPYTYHFHLNDPMREHPNWTPTIWDLIKKSQVAIGMTVEMAYFACGKRMILSGTVLSSSGNEASEILSCYGQKFLVEKGKVTKFVD